MRGRYAAAAILAFAALAATFDPKLYVNGDNADYILLGRAVLHGHLWSSAKYPPLFPLLLAPIQAVAGPAVVPQKLLVLAFAAGSIGLLWRIVRRRVGDRFGPFVLWIAATLLPVVEYAHYVMSEIPFLFFLLGAVDAADRLGGAGRSRRAERKTEAPPPRPPASLFRDGRVWSLALWLAAAFYVRSAGAAAAAGILLALFLARRRREALAVLALLLLLALPWLAHSLATPGGNPYLRQLLLVNPYYPEFGTLTPASLWRRIAQNAVFYIAHEIPSTVFPLFYGSTYSTPGQAWLPIGLSLFMLVPFLAGLAARLRSRDAAAYAVVSSLVLVLLWPLIWAGNRFLVPLVPLLFLLFWEGWGVLLRPLGGRWGRREPSGGKARREGDRAAGRSWAAPASLVPWVLLGLLLVMNGRSLVAYGLETRSYPPAWAHYFEALQWIRGHTPPRAVVVDRKPGFVEIVAGRSAVSFPREKDPEAMRAYFRSAGADYVVLPSLPYDDIGRYLQPALEQSRHWFDVAFQLPEPYTYVLRFYPEGRPGAASSGGSSE